MKELSFTILFGLDIYKNRLCNLFVVLFVLIKIGEAIEFGC